MGLPQMRGIGAKWPSDFYDYVNTNQNLVINGYKKACIALDDDEDNEGTCNEYSNEDNYSDIDPIENLQDIDIVIDSD